MKYLKKFINYRILLGIKRNNSSKFKINKIKIQKELLYEFEKSKFDFDFEDNFILSKKNIEKRTNQIFASLIILKLYKVIYFFYSFGVKIIYPLPTKFLKVLEANNINVNYSLSWLSCKILLFCKFLECISKIFKYIRKISFKKLESKICSKKNIYFISLPLMFISKNKLIINEEWVSKTFNLDIENLYFNKNIKIESNNKLDVLPRINIFSYLYFLKYTLKILVNFYKINYFLKLKSDEIIDLIFFKKSYKESIFNNVIISEEYRFNKPLWTYYGESKGWNIIYINFSTNHSNEIKFYPEEYKSAEYRYFSFTNNYFPTLEVSNFYLNKSYFISQTNNTVSNNFFDLVNNFRKKKFKNKIITIFDVHSSPRYEYETIPWGYYYYNSSILNAFYNDIIECLNKFDDLTIIVKRKTLNRHSLSRFDKNLKNLITKKINDKNRLFILDDVNIFKIIKNTDIAITMPFSSPAQIANMHKIPSIYYDSSNILKNIYQNSELKFFNKNQINELYDYFKILLKK